MYYIISLIVIFILLMLLSQIVIFEMTRNKMKKAGNTTWFLSLKKPYSYNRVGMMFFICFICYLISSPEEMFTAAWLIYFVIFLAIGIIADAIVQYLIIFYGKFRCRHEISEMTSLQDELTHIAETMYEDYGYEEDVSSYDIKTILDEYIMPTDHVAYMSIDEGRFVKDYHKFSEATFVVATYGDVENTQTRLQDTPVRVTKLTDSGQLPFKDEKMDVVVCLDSNYDKNEVKRVLKPNGYFLVNQNGTENLKEILQMYIPFGIKGVWNADSCRQTLDDFGIETLSSYEDFGKIRFRSIQAIHTYLQRVSPDLANIKKYQMFYMNALKAIKDHHFYEMTTHRFLVIGKKI